MKKKEIIPIFVIFVAILLVTLGIVIGIAVGRNGEENHASTEKGTESTQLTEETENFKDVIDSEVQTEDSELQVVVPSEPSKKEKTETFVILGVDSRTNQLGAGTDSDSIMVVHVNHDTKTVKVASILRDCMAKIEGHSFEKIKLANNYGGPDLALDTINKNYDLNISEYILVNFNSLIQLVDKIGGVEHELTYEECLRMGNYNRFTKPGKYLLTGEEALRFSRIRKAVGGDYKRSERQRQILFAIFNKAKTLSIDKRIEVFEEMIDKINTSYRDDEIIEVLMYLSKYKVVSMDVFPQIFYGGLVGEAWVEVPVTLVDMNKELHKYLFGTTNYVPSKTVKEYNEYLKDVASEANNNTG